MKKRLLAKILIVGILILTSMVSVFAIKSRGSFPFCRMSGGNCTQAFRTTMTTTTSTDPNATYTNTLYYQCVSGNCPFGWVKTTF